MSDILQLLHEIRAEVADGAMTTAELADEMGVSTKTMRLKIKSLLNAGKIARVMVPREDLKGVAQPIPAWVVVEARE